MDFKLLMTLFKKDRIELFQYLKRELSKHYDYVDTDGTREEFLYATGTLPVLLVAHLDTVFEDDYNLATFLLTRGTKYGKNSRYTSVPHPSTKEIFFDRQKMVMWSPTGLGADDRVGVFIILQLIKAGHRPHILFTTDEEIGSSSSIAFATKYKQILPEEIDFAIELDRQGSMEAVFYDCINEDFIQFIESYGFVENFGSFTDICNICPTLGFAGVNLSVGYKGEHTETERVYLKDTIKTMNAVDKILSDARTNSRHFKYEERELKKIISSSGAVNYFDTQLDYSGKERECIICSSKTREFLYAPEVGEICVKCFEEFY